MTLPSNIEQLLIKVEEGTITGEEINMLTAWLNDSPSVNAALLTEYLQVPVETETTLRFDKRWDNILTDILSSDKAGEIQTINKPAKILTPYKWLRYAAAAILIAGTGAYLWNTTTKKETRTELVKTTSTGQEILPAKDGVILTLGDGSQLQLDSLNSGIIAKENGTQVILKDGRLLYNAEHGNNTVVYNTMSTLKGKQFHLVLPDSTHVWLNAASSITYPTAFPGKRREVTVRGEAYFDIARNSSKPFIVNVVRNANTSQSQEEMKIQVLGTHFNVNAYNDEPSLRATLLQGSIKIITRSQSKILNPGQQAVLNDALKITNAVDMEQVVAWKNGLFDFNRADLPTVLRELGRWYDIDIVYDKSVSPHTFQGKIQRSIELSKVLSNLDRMGIRFRLTGRTLHVMP